MQVIDAIILGLVQGLTEFIPVSSSGHLVITQIFLAGASDHLFIEFLDIGTTLALLIFFRKRIAGVIKDIFVNKRYKFALNVLITAVPAGAIGFFMADFIGSSAFFGSMAVVAVTLSVVGVIMIILEKLPKAKEVKELEELPHKRALVIGLVQVLALIPGVSRSGSTIIAGRLMGFSAKHAAEYSFLAALPIMIGVAFKVLIKDNDYLMENLTAVVISNVAAFAAGLLAVGFLLKFLSKHGLAVFGWYRVGLGLILMTILLVQ